MWNFNEKRKNSGFPQIPCPLKLNYIHLSDFCNALEENLKYSMPSYVEETIQIDSKHSEVLDKLAK